jgi:hypothetical protein
LGDDKMQRRLFLKKRLDLAGMFAAVQAVGCGIGVLCFDQLGDSRKLSRRHAGNLHSSRSIPFIEQPDLGKEYLN